MPYMGDTNQACRRPAGMWPWSMVTLKSACDSMGGPDEKGAEANPRECPGNRTVVSPPADRRVDCHHDLNDPARAACPDIPCHSSNVSLAPFRRGPDSGRWSWSCSRKSVHGSWGVPEFYGSVLTFGKESGSAPGRPGRVLPAAFSGRPMVAESTWPLKAARPSPAIPPSAEAREVIVVGGINGDCQVNVLLDLAIMPLH